MRVLVTGGAGYVGAVLVPMLLAHGHAVRIVDKGLFGLDHLPPQAECIEADILDVQAPWFEDVDAVIHLAGISNDPMAALSPRLNYRSNATGTHLVAQAAKAAGVRRFVFASSCSVYGFHDEREVDEEFLVNPSFPYAISKVAAERSLLRLADRHFRPIILRKGTVVGWSPRMRFDLVTNTMVATALQERRIVVHNPGLWRPILDVVDAGRAYLCALAADLSVSGIFNIAGQNYTISCLAEEVAAALAEFGLDVPLEILHRPDVRSYRVSTTKAKRVLGFSPAVTMGETVRGIMRGIIANGIRDLADPRYYNVERLRQLIQGQEGWGHLWQRPAEGLFPIQRG